MEVVKGARNRVYVTDPAMWAHSLGTDYIWTPSTNTALVSATAGAGSILTEHGWAATSVAFATPSAADFMTSADTGTHAGLLTDATGDIIRSPIIFGDYNHARAVQQILGYFPTSLNLEVGADFTVASANETQTAFGFLEDGGTASVANDHMAAIFSDGTNFGLRSGAATDAGALIDTAYHVWRIRVTSSNVEWFIDGTSQGTIALQTDEWPVSFFGHSLTTNRFNLGFVHVYYR